MRDAARGTLKILVKTFPSGLCISALPYEKIPLSVVLFGLQPRGAFRDPN